MKCGILLAMAVLLFGGGFLLAQDSSHIHIDDPRIDIILKGKQYVLLMDIMGEKTADRKKIAEAFTRIAKAFPESPVVVSFSPKTPAELVGEAVKLLAQTGVRQIKLWPLDENTQGKLIPPPPPPASTLPQLTPPLLGN